MSQDARNSRLRLDNSLEGKDTGFDNTMENTQLLSTTSQRSNLDNTLAISKISKGG